MRNLWKNFCSPRHLMVFETAARLGSFTRAAQELNVQQPAVSATIRQLEERLGMALFSRSHRKITLTAAGERLFSDISMAYDQLAHSAEALRALTRSDYVTLNASTAFNNYWMMPRLAALHRLHPEIDLRLQSSDREPDIVAENISLAVRRGDGNWAGCEAALIAPEVIYPVASPRVMAAAGNLKHLSSLLRQRLVHLEEPVRDRPSWQDWFRHFDVKTVDPATGTRLNDYALVLQAAMAGEGFAFGWHHVVGPLVKQGLLASRKDWAWHTGKGFYLVWSSDRPLAENAMQVRDWVLSQSG